MKVDNSGWIKDENWKYKREFYTSMVLMSWLQVLYVYNRLRPRKLSRNKFGKENRKKKKKNRFDSKLKRIVKLMGAEIEYEC